MDKRALVRRPGPRLAEGLVTHIERSEIDLDLALRQWDGYVAALRDEGWETIEVPPADDCPDAVFVEDTVVVYGDLAVISRPGADERRPETAAAEETLARLGYRIARIEAPGTLDGGDVLKHDGTVWVGLGGRTNRSGSTSSPRTWTARRRGGRRTAHQGAAPQVGRHRAARRHRRRLPAAGRRPAVWPRCSTSPRSPASHVVLLDEQTVLMSTQRTAHGRAVHGRGLRVVAVDLTEYEKLEGCVTCLSVRLRGLAPSGAPTVASTGTHCYGRPRGHGSPMLRRMVSVRGVDVGRVLEAAASGSPVEAVEAVARELGAAFDAAAVSFLIADLSGRALVRLAHVPLVGGKA